MHDVGQKVVVLQSVVDIHLLIVDGQRSGFNAPLLRQQQMERQQFSPRKLTIRNVKPIRSAPIFSFNHARPVPPTRHPLAGNCRSKADGINNIPWKRQPSKHTHTERENQIKKKIKKTNSRPLKKRNERRIKKRTAKA